MLYGLTGASGVGKTTLGGLLEDSLELTFVKTSVTECAKKHGYNAVGNLSMDDRIALQFHLLDDHVELINNAPRPIITDRTPIDMAAYMLAEIEMRSDLRMTTEQMEKCNQYVFNCQDVTSTYYDCLFHLDILPEYEVDDSRPPYNPAFQRHIDLLMRGLLLDTDGLTYAYVHSDDLAYRHEFVSDVITKRMDYFEKERKKHPKVH